MKKKILWTVIISGLFLLAGRVGALPAPCSSEDLLNSSEYAVEGIVMDSKCESTYDSKECSPLDESIKCVDHFDEHGNSITIPCPAENFQPRLVADCVATVKVTKNLKGKYKEGDKVKIPFKKLVQDNKGGDCIIPGSPTKDFRKGAKIEYYNSDDCKYDNFLEINSPMDKPNDIDNVATNSKAKFPRSILIFFSVGLASLFLSAFLFFSKSKK